MKQTINFYQFCDSFNDNLKDTFSYKGKKALFEYLEDYEEGTGEEIELDVIALCCEYTEYKNMKEFQADYGDKNKTLEDIEAQTQVIKIDEDSFIIQRF